MEFLGLLSFQTPHYPFIHEKLWTLGLIKSKICQIQNIKREIDSKKVSKIVTTIYIINICLEFKTDIHVKIADIKNLACNP
jgi:hypothetical protein